MKRLITHCLIGAIFAMCLLPFAATNLKAQTPGGTPIVIVPEEPNNPEEEPRSPVFNPFSAYLQNNQVILNCSTSYGLVSVSLVSTAGDNYSTVFDTGDGFIFIPISGNMGDYTLVLLDSLGTSYVGEFSL